VLAQRLVRLLCHFCKRPYKPSDQELHDSGLRPADVADKTFFRNVGCDACNHTGYRGRTAIHEILDMSDNVREMIVERRPGSEIRRQAEKEGLASLRESAIKKVFAGVTTLYEINRVTFVEEIR
jgi:type IV pilus assembly protein PilB